MPDTPRPLRVLQAVHALGMGGAETWLMDALRHWARTRAVTTEFLITGGESAIFDEEAKALGARLHYVKYGRRDLPRFARAFRGLLRDARFDALHDHADYAAGWHFLLGAGALPPVRVAHVHNPRLHLDANYAISPARRVTMRVGKRLVERLASHVCGTSAEILRAYGFTPGQTRRPAVSVVHCGIDVAKFNTAAAGARDSVLREFGWTGNAKLVLFAGRLDRALTFDDPRNHKNSWLALNIARAALARDPSVRLLMAGASEDDGRQLQARIDAWGLSRELRLLGVRKDMPHLMHAADALLFPSRQEGLGMVAVEAQAAALPVLASTAVPREAVVIPELYDAMPLTASTEQWVDALLHALRKARPTLEHCRRALEASPFSIEHSTRQLEAIYAARPA